MEKKKQATIYVTAEEEEMLNRLLFLRAARNEKTTRSALFCEGLRVVYEKEIPGLTGDLGVGG